MQRDAYRVRARMAQHVRERLLADAIQRRVHTRIAPARARTRIDDDADSAAGGELLGAGTQRHRQTIGIEHRRTQRAGDVAHAFGGRFDARDRVVEPGGNERAQRARQLVLDQVQIEIRRSEVLADAVVQLRRQPASLALLRIDDAPAHRAQARREATRFFLGAAAFAQVDDGRLRRDEAAVVVAQCGDVQRSGKDAAVLAHELGLQPGARRSVAQRVEGAHVAARAARAQRGDEGTRTDQLAAGEAQPAQFGAIHLQDRSVGRDAVIPARRVLVEIAKFGHFDGHLVPFAVPFAHGGDCGTGHPLAFPIVIPPQGLSGFPYRSLPASAVQ